MLMSMTGFGKAVAVEGSKKITVEIKSLNSKQMDLNVRLPHSYCEKELEIRSLVSGLLERGKVDVSVSVEQSAGALSEMAAHINHPAMAAYKADVESMASALGIAPPSDWYSVLLRFPDAFRTDSAQELGDAESAALFSAVDKAMSALMEHRRSEGARLEAFFGERIARIHSLLESVEPFEKERVEKIRLRMEDSLSKIPVAEYDKGRLEQEMIFYIEKLDVNEEKQRLAQHLNYFMETMEAPRPGQGKKLGFIAQEMGREINTLGSKSNHAEMQKIVVLMKDALEQIKEQVLNVM